MLYVFVNRRGDLALPDGKTEFPTFTNKADAEMWLQWVKHWKPTEEEGIRAWFGAVENTNIHIQVLTQELLLRGLENNGIKVSERLVMDLEERKMTDEEYELLLLDDEYPMTPMALNPDLSYHKNIEDWMDAYDMFLTHTGQDIKGDMIRLLGYDHTDYGKALAKAVEAENARHQRRIDEDILAGITDIRIYDPEGLLDFDPNEDDFPRPI